ncbi:hypothetical protein GCM10011344_20360 [Dokdonia pacifica]|uniref:Kelch motif-containing protein n=1 Tax=Dokdonia pacifica TaxID=1627892 RepID=A0A238VN80_9FLAO|nr:hypothetical protein [Dokdonia pacifica]GGG19590.1 hypothetical protein GCM10011344_20360 [Dokdonia pacifica]SNR35820.1 Kelch motif-containing protein [Dokdonia pacifica]
MKTTIIRLFIIPLSVITLLISCNTDDDVAQPEIGMEDPMDDIPNDDDDNDDDTANLNLTFTLHTQQDQIGDFAFHQMAAFNGNVHSYYGAGLGATTDMPYNLGVWHSANGIAWESDASFGSERRGHSVTEFNGDLFLIGGADNDDNELEEVWISNDGFFWTLGSDLLPFGAVSFHSTVVLDDQLYLITDDYEDDDGTQMMAVYRSNDGFNWDLIATDVFPIRTAAETVVFNNSIYLIGGTNDSNFLNDIWTSEDGISWSQVTPSGSFTDPIVFHTLNTYENALWLIGGWSNINQYNNHIWYSQDGINWINYDGEIPFDGLYAHETLVYEDELWIFGGVQEDGLSGAIGSIKIND